jgi:uncharacterized protein (DUF58 family)
MVPLFESTFLQKLDRLSLMTRRAMAGAMQGERRSVRRGSSVEFADFRPYTIGDDIRQIDWNLYARLERLFLKLFVAEEELTVHFLLDTSNSMNWGEPNKFDFARRLIGAIGYITLNSSDRVIVTGLGTSFDRLPGVRGKRGALPLFQFLQKVSPGGSTNLTTICHRYMHMARMSGPLVLCSDLLDSGWQNALRSLLSRPFEITLIHILAPQEMHPQIDGDFRLIDSEGGPTVEITADFETLRRYQDHLSTWRDEVETFCHGHGITYLFAETSTPVETFVVDQLRMRGVVRSW